MKFFANKKIFNKILIILIVIISVSFVLPNVVHADIGGALMQPVCKLILGIGDGIIRVIHNLLLDQNMTLIRVTAENGWVQIVQVVIAAVVLVCIAIAIVSGFGIIAGTATLPLKLIAIANVGVSVLAKSAKGLIIGAVLVYSVGAFTDEVDLPIYSITPEEIFTNKVPIFSVNFINPSDDDYDYMASTLIGSFEGNSLATIDEFDNFLKEKTQMDYDTFKSKSEYGERDGYLTYDYSKNEKGEGYRLKLRLGNGESGQIQRVIWRLYELRNGKEVQIGDSLETGGPGDAGRDEKIDEWMMSLIGIDSSADRDLADDGYTWIYTVNGKEYIVRGTDVESSPIIKYELYEKEIKQIHPISSQLQGTISKWYNILRIIAIVGMMSVLVYIGIRILISSTAGQKAKHKELLKDWLIGMVLLFTMHYIMSFSNVFVRQLTYLLTSVNPINHMEVIVDSMGDKNNPQTGKIKEALEQEDVPATSGDGSKLLYDLGTNENGEEIVEWHTNLMGTIRIRANAFWGTDDGHIGYTLMFAVMVIYTVIFCWTYIKRVIYMAFLTVIAPLVALTYPIDKANDGKAQGFDIWFKEYIFNLLLQPMHLLIYTVFISAAIEIATKNWIYSLVVLGFIATAEKIVRRMFNFEKAKTPGVFSGAGGAALAMSGMRWLFGRGSKGGSGGKKVDGIEGSSDETKYTSAKTKSNVNKLFENIDAGETSTPVAQLNERKIPNTSEIEQLDNTNGRAQLIPGGFSGKEEEKKKKTMNAVGLYGREALEKARKTGRGIRDVGGYYIDQKKRKLKRDLKNARPIRGIAKAYMGTGLATIGLAAGIAEGNAGHALQHAGQGFLLGSKVGGSIYNSTHVDGLGDIYERSKLGEDEYKKRQAYKNQMEVAEKESTITAIQGKMGCSRSQAKEWAKEWAPLFMNEGINDVSDWINIQKMHQNTTDFKVKHKDGSLENQYSIDESIAAYKLYERYNLSNKSLKEKDIINQIQNDYANGDLEKAKRYYRAAKDYDNVKNG